MATRWQGLRRRMAGEVAGTKKGENRRLEKWLPLVDTFRTFYLFPSSKNMRLIERYRSLRSDVA
jgi:hypothetical protein